MKILALQLKRIGDLILTTPALNRLRSLHPEAHVTLAVQASTSTLLPAIPNLSAGIVFGPGRGWTPWQQTLTGPWDAVLDFTGTDRSALATALSRSRRRITFEGARKKKLRALAYNVFVDSPVRDFHTVEHYAHLLQPLGVEAGEALQLRLDIPEKAKARTATLLGEASLDRPFAIVHPGAARAEKLWDPARWAKVVEHLRSAAGLDCILTGSAETQEAAYVEEVRAAAERERGVAGAGGRLTNFAGKMDLLELGALVEKAQLIVSGDTALVHLAAAFQRPQIALFGPTNPFHWRPRHDHAVVLSAARPEAPLTEFNPRMKGAPMDRLSTEVVIRATDSLLQRPFTPANP